MLSTDNGRQVLGGHREAAVAAAAGDAAGRGHEAGDLGGAAAAEDLPGVLAGPKDGDSAQEPAEEHVGGAEAPVRDGGVLHALQPAAHPPDLDSAHGADHVLQAQELQDRRILREALAGAGSASGSGPTSPEDPAGLRHESHRRTSHTI